MVDGIHDAVKIPKEVKFDMLCELRVSDHPSWPDLPLVIYSDDIFLVLVLIFPEEVGFGVTLTWVYPSKELLQSVAFLFLNLLSCLSWSSGPFTSARGCPTYRPRQILATRVPSTQKPFAGCNFSKKFNY